MSAVIAIDNNPTRLALARHNAQIYGVADHIEFILADFVSFAKSYLASHPPPASRDARKIDAIFLSPPWGGPSYLDGSTSLLNDEDEEAKTADAVHGHPPYSLASIHPIHGAELFHLSRKITKNIAYYLPRNTRMEEVSELLQEQPAEMVEVEEAWTGSKLKAITCYFGGLASGQEVMF
jgi:trimethylguanosine synthase